MTIGIYTFFIYSLLLNITPGNDMLLVISRSVAYGSRAGIVTSIGIFIGCLVHISFTVAGLSFLIAKSDLLFNIIKIIGSLFLIYIGLNAILKKQKHKNLGNINDAIITRNLLLQGILTSILNPKVAIFFLSFLPQFIDISKDVSGQLLFLGMWFNTQGFLILILVSFIAGSTRNIMKSNSRAIKFQKYLTGILMIGLGIKLLFVRR